MSKSASSTSAPCMAYPHKTLCSSRLCNSFKREDLWKRMAEGNMQTDLTNSLKRSNRRYVPTFVPFQHNSLTIAGWRTLERNTCQKGLVLVGCIICFWRRISLNSWLTFEQWRTANRSKLSIVDQFRSQYSLNELTAASLTMSLILSRRGAQNILHLLMMPNYHCSHQKCRTWWSWLTSIFHPVPEHSTQALKQLHAAHKTLTTMEMRIMCHICIIVMNCDNNTIANFNKHFLKILKLSLRVFFHSPLQLLRLFLQYSTTRRTKHNHTSLASRTHLYLYTSM